MGNVLKDHKEFLKLLVIHRTSRSKRKRMDARDRILNESVPLVASIARTYIDRGLPLEDMIQEGFFGLDRALQKFDESRGLRFSTYATWWIRQTIMRALQENNDAKPLHIPTDIQDQLRHVRMAMSIFHRDHSGWPTPEEAFKIIHRFPSKQAKRIRLKKIAWLMELNFQRYGSLDANIRFRNGGDDGGMTRADVIADPRVSVEKEVESRRVTERLRAAIAQLPPREALILRHRFGLDDAREMSMTEIGQALDITYQRVRQIESKALERLRVILEPQSL